MSFEKSCPWNPSFHPRAAGSQTVTMRYQKAMGHKRPTTLHLSPWDCIETHHCSSNIYNIYTYIYIYMFLIFHHYILRIMGQQYWTSKVDGLILNKLCDCGPIGAWILIHTHTIFTLICRGYRLSQINEAFQQATGWLGPHKSILTVETWGGYQDWYLIQNNLTQSTFSSWFGRFWSLSPFRYGHGGYGGIAIFSTD